MEVGSMEPGEIRSGEKPEVIESPHVAQVLSIMEKQLEILRLLSLPAVYIPAENLEIKKRR